MTRLGPDPVDWVEHWWNQRELGNTDRVLAMTSLLRTRQLVAGSLATVLKRLDLNLKSYFLLLSLDLSDEGSLLLSQLARQIMVHPTTVTQLTDRLEQQGFIARERHRSDRRAIFARITPAGRTVVDEATRALAEIDFGVPQLSSHDAARLVELLSAPHFVDDTDEPSGGKL